jgi:hypothetical protein
MERRQQEVTSRPRRMSAMGDPALGLDLPRPTGPADGWPDLRVEDRIDRRAFRGRRERTDDVEIQ